MMSTASSRCAPSSLVKGALLVGALVGAVPAPALANGLLVEAGRVERTASGAFRVTAKVSWKNGWRTSRNHDAVWLFAKIRPRANAGWRHARLVSVRPASSGVQLSCSVPSDRVGAFCAPASAHRGDVASEVVLEIDSTALREADRQSAEVEARVLGIEMVYIPEGPFSIGDSDPKAIADAALYRSNAQGGFAGLFRVTSEAAITIAPEEGALYYQQASPQYSGDRGGPLPAEFPKGTRAFYVMKYELLQGQYADFLDIISREAAFFRANNAGPGYHDERGTIRLEGRRYVADRRERPANWISWDDGTAFADWAGLRPMTELEFTKAARGPVEPVPGDYPWGTSSKDRLLRRMGEDGELRQTGDADESHLTDRTRDQLGASYYWVMDLAGSVWEKVVTVGHPAGRAFRGTHGDGQLRNYGIATNPDWPTGDHDGGGYGYRGGGYYERGFTEGDRNPYSPVAWRFYGAWGGGPRSIAYGFRGVRTVE